MILATCSCRTGRPGPESESPAHYQLGMWQRPISVGSDKWYHRPDSPELVMASNTAEHGNEGEIS